MADLRLTLILFGSVLVLCAEVRVHYLLLTFYPLRGDAGRVRRRWGYGVNQTVIARKMTGNCIFINL